MIYERQFVRICFANPSDFASIALILEPVPLKYISYQEMNFKEILHKFRTESFTEREKGTKFERLMRSWLLTDPRYNELESVWLWEDFPGRKDFGGTDTGIDLVAKTELGDYWAIQCKCYAENTIIDKPAVDSFLATSSRSSQTR